MLISPPPNKSGSNWLDRLRSNKGIPTGDNLDLGSFLLTHSHNSLVTRPKNPTRTRSQETRDPPLTMSTVLAQLFHMGATLTQTSKKCPRKQPHPKFFLASNSTTTASPAVPVANPSIIRVAEAEEEEEEGEEEEEAVDRGDDDDNDKEGNELKGFSKSEVTVIDTSCPGWKVDKFVFRKNNVWKIRERKPKFRSVAKKKSKESTVMANGHGDDVNGIGSSKDNVIDKPVKTHMLI